MSLGKLVVSLVAESAEFIKGFDRASQAATRGARSIDVSMGSIVKGVLASEVAVLAGQAALTRFTAAFEAAGQAIDSAQSLGTTPEKFLAMRHAVELAGDQFDTIPGLLNRFNATLAETGDEARGKGLLLRELGLSLTDLKAADPVDALKSVAVALQGIQDPATRVRVGQELLGKAYAESAPALAAFAASGDDTRGITVEMLQAMDDLSDSFARYNTEANITATIVAGTLAPTFSELMDQLVGTESKGGDLTEFLTNTLNVALKGGALVLLTLKEAVLQAGNALGSLGAAIAHLATGNTDAAWAALEVGARRSRQIAEETIAAGRAVLDAEKNAAIAARQAKGDFSDIADATERAARSREYFNRTEREAQNAAARSEAQTKRLTTVLGNLGNKGPQGPSRVTQEFMRLQDEIDRATLSARDYQLRKLKAGGATSAQVQRYSVQLDTLDAAKAAQAFSKELEDLQFQASLIGASPDQQAVAEYSRRLEEAGIKGEQAAELLELFQSTLSAGGAATFAQELAALNAEIEKVGKTAQQQAEIDIKARYSNPDDQAQMLAANAELFKRVNEQGVQGIFDSLAAESANVGASPLTAYINELKEAQKLNPLITDQVIQLAAAQKQAALESAAAWEQNQQLANDAATAVVNSVEALLQPGADAEDVLRNLGLQFANMAMQALVLGPLLESLKTAFSSMGGANGGGGGMAGLISSGIGALFGGGKALGGDVQPSTLYEVAEQGPELARINGRTYLMTGARGGTVEPAATGLAARPIGSSQPSRNYVLNVSQSFNGVRDVHDVRRSRQQTSGLLAMQVRQAVRVA